MTLTTRLPWTGVFPSAGSAIATLQAAWEHPGPTQPYSLTLVWLGYNISARWALGGSPKGKHSVMPQSLSCVLVHIVFSTKGRNPWLNSGLQTELYPYFGGVLRNTDCPAVQIGGVKDHVHILAYLSRMMAVAKLVENLKTSSSKLMKAKGVPEFAWQSGYGAFSVSSADLDQVVAYIQGQPDHHKERTFEEEYREMLTLSRTPFDERYYLD